MSSDLSLQLRVCFCVFYSSSVQSGKSITNIVTARIQLFSSDDAFVADNASLNSKVDMYFSKAREARNHKKFIQNMKKIVGEEIAELLFRKVHEMTSTHIAFVALKTVVGQACSILPEQKKFFCVHGIELSIVGSRIHVHTYFVDGHGHRHRICYRWTS